LGCTGHEAKARCAVLLSKTAGVKPESLARQVPGGS